MNDMTIKLDNISKSFKLFRRRDDRVKEIIHPLRKKYHTEFCALKNINLEVNKGEVLGIVGKNGSGKTTLLKIISGVLTPNQGKVSINGRIAALLELGAGFNPEYTGLENLKFYNSILGIDEAKMEESLEETIAFADIGEFIDQPFKIYSSGMQSRLAFAAAVQVDPDILIVDEVLAVGDETFKRKCFKKINEFLNMDKTVLLVSHSIHTINQFCTRAILLDENKIIDDGTPKNITQHYYQTIYQNNSESKTQSSYKSKEPEGKKLPSIHRTDYSTAYETMQIEILTHENIRNGEICITDTDDLKVNILHILSRYTVCCSIFISPTININEVLVGFTLVNSQGVHVCGMEPVLEMIDENHYLARKSFDCCLNEDTYSIIVASRLRSHEAVYYTRNEECAGFNVVNTSGEFRWGLVHL